MTEAIRIAVLNFVHETVTFLPNNTTLDDFVHDGSPASGEALLAWEPRSYMGGFVKVAREHAGVELVGTESPLWPRTGTGSGWITREAYEHFLGRMIAELERGGRWHGVYLALHGAMGVRGVARPEADIARGVREVVGRDAFIAGTFDPHGNEDAEFLRQADFAFCAKYFPHYDSRLQGERAARMLIRAICGDYTPVSATVKVPILTATVLQWTDASPWMYLVQRALVWEAREPDLYMNVFFGFPFADVPDVGMTVQAMTNGKPALARKAADDVATWAWRRREALLKTATVHPIPHGVKLAREAVARGAWPVVLADHSRPLWLGDVGPAAGDRARPGRRADCHHRRSRGRRGGRGQGSEGRRSVRHGRWRPGRRVRRPAGADRGHDRGSGAHRRQALGERRLRARQRRADQRAPHPGHGPARPDGAGIHDRSVQGICDQVACALPPRLRRFGLREDDPIGRAGAAAPRHDTARGAALPERRHLEVLSLRRRQLSFSERRAPSQRHPNLNVILDHPGRPRGATSPL